MDLYEYYRTVARTYFPQATICEDSFHVIKHLTEAFNAVRLRCCRTSEDDYYKYLLIKLKHIFESGITLDTPPRYNKKLRREVSLRDIQNILFEKYPELEPAYQLKEMYLRFNRYSTIETATENFDKVRTLFGDSGIPEYEEFYKLLGNWKQEILNSFTRVEDRRINNSHIESKNRIIEKLMSNANGFKNFSRTRNRILYCLNKKDTYTL